MKRSQLKNVINKAKELSNKPTGDPFDEFKKSLPIGIDDNYRLEAAWKAYGKPKNFQEAIFYGLVLPIDDTTYKLPSIGYDEESDSYEYLNSGKENETVARDIRVWDNDVIPFVKELKQGGYIRTFNDEKNCWTYSKNKPQEILIELREVHSFLKGGKPKLDSKEAGEEPVGYLNDGTPLYKKGDGTIGPLTKENIGKDNLFDLIKNSNVNWAKRLQDPNRKYITYPDGSIGNFKLAWSEDETGTIVYPEILEIDGLLIDLSKDKEKAWRSAIEHKDYIYFPSNDAAEWFIKNYKNYYKGFDKTPQAFRQGGKPKKVKSDLSYYDPETDTIYYSGEKRKDRKEAYKHEYVHSRPDEYSELFDYLKPYYENLNDDKISELGGNLEFVKRFNGDPNHFYNPEELVARMVAASYRTRNVPEYSEEFFEDLRLNENKYGNNMRDLLYMYNNKNLSLMFKYFRKPISGGFGGGGFYQDPNGEIGDGMSLRPTGKYAPDGLEYYISPNGDRYTLQPQAFKQGGQMNVIPDGSLHARKNNMEGAGEDFTAKGIPVMTIDGKEQVAEIEKNEIIFNKDLTNFLEENYKKFYKEETSNDEKDDLAIKVGKRLVKEILENTEDNTGLILEVDSRRN